MTHKRKNRYSIQVQARLVVYKPTGTMPWDNERQELIVIPWKQIYEGTIKSNAIILWNRFLQGIDFMIGSRLL